MSDEDDDTDVMDGEDADDETSAESSSEEVLETRSSEAHRRLREQMESEIEAFLSKGGKIEQVNNGSSARYAPMSASAGDMVG